MLLNCRIGAAACGLGAALLLATQADAAGPLARLDTDALLPAAQAFALMPVERHGDALQLSWNIAPGYYLYRTRIQVELLAPASVGLQPIQLPDGDAHRDEFFGEVQVYRGLLQAAIPLSATPLQPLQLRIRFQGCAEAGVCYPPQTIVQTLAP